MKRACIVIGGFVLVSFGTAGRLQAAEPWIVFDGGDGPGKGKQVVARVGVMRSTDPRRPCRSLRRFRRAITASNAPCSSPSTDRTARSTRRWLITSPDWRH
jgi:hypothetical protein